MIHEALQGFAQHCADSASLAKLLQNITLGIVPAGELSLHVCWWSFSACTFAGAEYVFRCVFILLLSLWRSDASSSTHNLLLHHQLRELFIRCHVAGSGNGVASSLDAADPVRAVLNIVRGVQEPIDLYSVMRLDKPDEPAKWDVHFFCWAGECTRAEALQLSLFLVSSFSLSVSAY